MGAFLRYAVDASLVLLAGFGVVELVVFLGAAFLTRQNFDFDDERDL
jgi:hypothetical protein